MRVKAEQIVVNGRHVRGLGVQPQLRVAGPMVCAPVLLCDVAVVTDISQILQTYMTGCGRVIRPQVRLCHPPGLWIA